MRCVNCGQELPEGTKFCNNCGAPVANVQQTQRMSQAGQPSHMAPTGPAPYPQQVPQGMPAPQPVQQKSNTPLIIALVALAAVLIAVVVLFVVPALSGNDATPTEPDTPVTEPQPSTPEPSTPEPSEPAPSEPSSGGQSTSEPTSSAQDEANANAAQQFAVWFFGNHILAGGANDDPSAIDVDTWKSMCLQYVEPGSALEAAIQSATGEYGENTPFETEAADVVTDVEVVSSSNSVVQLVVLEKMTQSDWGYADTWTNTCTIEFDDNGLIVRVSGEVALDAEASFSYSWPK